MDIKRSRALRSSSITVAPDVLPVIYHDLRHGIEEQHRRLFHLRLVAGIAMAVAIVAAGLLLDGPPLSLLAEISLLFLLLVVGFGSIVMLPIDLGRRELTLVSLKAFEPSVSAEALARRLVAAARNRIETNEPRLQARSLFLRITLVSLVAQVALLCLAVAGKLWV
ncbi:MAG: hypothetical protein AAF962_26620 [Actinomycetota bacterium]